MTQATKTKAIASPPPGRAIGSKRFYLVSPGQFPTCGRLGYRIMPCPTCGVAVRTGPALYLVSIPAFFEDRPCSFGHGCGPECPLSEQQIARHVSARAPYRAGLLWAPLARYPTGRSFVRALDADPPIAWPVRKFPASLVIGSTPILLGHAKGITDADGSTSPSIFAIFVATAIVYVPRPTDRAPYLRRLRRLGVELRETAPDGVP